jgi:hypothetical protein
MPHGCYQGAVGHPGSRGATSIQSLLPVLPPSTKHRSGPSSWAIFSFRFPTWTVCHQDGLFIESRPGGQVGQHRSAEHLRNHDVPFIDPVHTSRPWPQNETVALKINQLRQTNAQFARLSCLHPFQAVPTVANFQRASKSVPPSSMPYVVGVWYKVADDFDAEQIQLAKYYPQAPSSTTQIVSFYYFPMSCGRHTSSRSSVFVTRGILLKPAALLRSPVLEGQRRVGKAELEGQVPVGRAELEGQVLVGKVNHDKP